MTQSLWAHQRADIQTYLKHPDIVNLSEPGTGKTRVCIEVIKALGLPTLVLAPKSILQCAWGDDIETFSPELSYSIAYAENRLEAFSSNSQIVITNHDAVNWIVEHPEQLNRFLGGFLIIDESTAFKTPTSKRTKAVMLIRSVFNHCTVLTGTPTPQGLIDLWAQVYLVDQGQRLGKSFYRFRHDNYTPVNKGAFTEWKEKAGAAEAAADLISDITIRNCRDDCMDLPENFMVHRRFKLSPSHMAKYNELKRTSIVELESGEVTAVNAAALLQKLLQVASGAVYDEFGVPHLVNADRYDLIMDLAEERDHSLIVFNWRHQRDYMMSVATRRKYSFGVIDGSVTNGDRRALTVREFQDGRLKCLFIHPKSAGHGLTLTKGCATIWASPTYNAEYFEQVNARIHRGGQTRVTETIMISAEDTADDAVYKSLMLKRLNMRNLLELLE